MCSTRYSSKEIFYERDSDDWHIQQRKEFEQWIFAIRKKHSLDGEEKEYLESIYKWLNKENRPEAFYHLQMGLNKTLYDIFYTHVYITQFKAQTNLILLKTFLSDPLLKHEQRKEHLKHFSRKSWTFCTWKRLLPEHTDEATLNALSAYLFDISEETLDEIEKQKFIASDMIPYELVRAHKTNRSSLVHKALHGTLQEVRSLVAREEEKSASKELLEKLHDWVQDFRDANIALVDPRLSFREQLRYFLERYKAIVDAMRPQLPPELYEKLFSIMAVCTRYQEMEPKHYIERLGPLVKQESLFLFNHILGTRLASTWAASMVIESGYIEYHDKKLALLKGGLGIAEGVLHCIPLISGIPKILHSSATIFEALHKSPVLEWVTEGVSAVSACLEGYEVCLSKYHFHKFHQLSLNLGMYGNEYMENISNVFSSRYEEQISRITKKEVIEFAEDVSEFILKFLTTVTLTPKERDESLALLLIIWCSNVAKKGQSIPSMSSESESITSGDLLSRVEISCQFETKETSTVSLGSSPFWKKTADDKALSSERFGMAKSTSTEIALFRSQLQPREFVVPEAKVFSVGFSEEIIARYQSHAHEARFFKENLLIEPPRGVKLKQLESKVEALTARLETLERAKLRI